MTAAMSALLANVAGEFADGSPTVERALLDGGSFSVRGQQLADGASTQPTFATCARGCVARADCVAWDYLAAEGACRLLGTMLGFAVAPGSVAGHKGFKRAGVSACIYTGSTDIETECDGVYTYDRARLKYDGDAFRSVQRQYLEFSLVLKSG